MFNPVKIVYVSSPTWSEWTVWMWVSCVCVCVRAHVLSVCVCVCVYVCVWVGGWVWVCAHRVYVCVYMHACVYKRSHCTSPVDVPFPDNHIAMSKKVGLEVKQYRYFKSDTCGLDFEGMLEDLRV